ncbi:MAG: SDR family NAD(P)-dependent oxidoreductase [Candidatus Saccharibacteria bacterium]|nr:SDR family NAD(P)-dependent oxidoreductase [Candidatus Saccharibacteria bacterium]
MKLQNKISIVTGASSGIGLAIAKLYLQEGATVVFSDISDGGNKIIENLGEKASFVKCDVSKSQEVHKLVEGVIEKFGKLDIMVNNAGIGVLGGALDCTDGDWDKIIGVNLSGVFYGVSAAANAMKATQVKGSIINMSSILGLVGLQGTIAYSAAKGGVSNLTRAAAQDLAQLGIRVNAIAPAFIKTNMTKAVLEDETFNSMIKANTPLGYVGDPEDIAHAALYLASDDARYVTGIVLPVDGGWTCR